MPVSVTKVRRLLDSREHEDIRRYPLAAIAAQETLQVEARTTATGRVLADANGYLRLVALPHQVCRSVTDRSQPKAANCKKGLADCL